MTSQARLGILTAALLVGALVTPGTVSAATPECFGQKATIVGTNGSDSLRGGSGKDVIVARGGPDVIRGRGGNDLICAGDGGDEIIAGGGNDKVSGGGGPDALIGGGGNDLLKDPKGGFQFFLPGSGDDKMIGNPNANFDFVSYIDAANGVVVDLTAGTATGHGTDTVKDFDAIDGSDFDDQLTGTDGINLILGNDGNDAISALGGPAEGDPADIVDFLAGGEGTDDLDGGDGLDVIDYSDAPAGVNVDLATQQVSGGDSDAIAGIEGVIGSLFDDELIGSPELNGFEGQAGNDTIDGAEGNDFVVYFGTDQGVTVDLAAGTSSGNGSDTLTNIEDAYGSSFADVISGTDGDNRLLGGPGGDDLTGLAGNDFLDGGRGDDSLDGGEGTDSCVSGTPTNCESDQPPGFLAKWPSMKRIFEASRFLMR